MNKKVLIFAVALMAVAMLATPIIGTVMAVPPTRGTFTQYIVQVTVAPGTEFVRGNVMHGRGQSSESYLYGAPWGNSIDGAGLSTHVKLNLVSFIGSGILKTVDSYDGGTVIGSIKVEMIGFGPYTYNGPTFSFEVGGVSGEVTNGVTYVGILFTGFGVKHGISSDLKGLETKETFTGLIVAVGPLAGVNIVENTVTYKLPA